VGLLWQECEFKIQRQRLCKLRTIWEHQQNVIQSGSNTQSSQVLWVTSQVLLSTSRCSQSPLQLSNVLSDSPRVFTGVRESTCSYGGALKRLQDLTYRIVKFWRCWDIWAGLRETTKEAETAGQLWGILQEQLRPLRSPAGDLLLFLTAVVLTKPQGILSLLQSQVLLHHIMACIIQVSVYIYIRSIWPQIIFEHNRRSTWTRPIERSLRCTTWRQLWWNDGARRQRAHYQHCAAPLATSKRNAWGTVVLVRVTIWRGKLCE